jgi:class 3 adenylate cyclase
MTDNSDLSNLLGGILYPQQQKPNTPSLSVWAELLKTTQPPPLSFTISSSSQPAPSQPNVLVSRKRIFAALSQAADGDITDGRVLPSLDAIPVANGRKLKAAVLYNDLKGFSGLVAGLPKKKTLIILHAFVTEMTRIASEYGGEVIDCAGDRIMAVFWRPHNNNDRQPIYDAICCGFWMQTIMDRAFRDVLINRRLPTVSCGIGIDYGDMVVTRVGIRNRNKLVLLGKAANFAAKLEDIAAEGQTVISPIIYNNKPPSMTVDNGWLFQAHPTYNNPVCYVSNNVFKNDTVQREYVKRQNGK